MECLACLLYKLKCWIRILECLEYLRLRYGMEASCSSQNWDILIASRWSFSPSAEFLYLCAWLMHFVKYSPWSEPIMLKKYSRGGPLPAGYLSGK